MPPSLAAGLALRHLTADDVEKNIRLFNEPLPGDAWLTPVKKADFFLWSERQASWSRKANTHARMDTWRSKCRINA